MPPRKTATAKQRTLSESLQEYGRGVAGGLMFSLPLMYTMEVWWMGIVAHPFRLIGYVLATFVLLIGYNRYAGLRRDSSMAEVAIDSVEEMGIGLLIAGLVLFLLGRVTAEMSLSQIAGVFVLEGMTVAIGVSIGTAQLGAGGKEDEGLGEGDSQKGISFGGQMVMALCGAVLFGANVAPTEEIIVIAIEISWMKLMGLAILSLLVAFVILHFSDFRGADRFVRADHPTIILLGTFLTYSIALIASGLILWFFGRFDGVSLLSAVSQTIVLALPATLGASAGRLLLQ